jgi:BASS family bile acid:Na+ symporter
MMESVAARFLATPIMTIGLAALAFIVAFAVLVLTTLLFVSAGRDRALTLGFTASERNTGLMLAATAGALPDLSWLYFAFSYFPMYLLPLLLQPLTRRKVASARTNRTPPPGPTI